MRIPIIRSLEWCWLVLSVITWTILADPVGVAVFFHDVHHKFVGRDKHLIWCFAALKDADIGHYVLSDMTPKSLNQWKIHKIMEWPRLTPKLTLYDTVVEG